MNSDRTDPGYRARIRALVSRRRAAFVSQWDLAERIGRSTTWLGAIERLHRAAPMTTIAVIEEALAGIIAERDAVARRA